MKKLFLFGALVFAAAVESQAQPDLIARIHFAGVEKISADTNSLAFTNEFCSAEAMALKAQTLDKLSYVPGAWFKSKIAAGAGDGSAQLRPLLDDLLKSEWIFEMRDTTNGSPEYALAIRLNPEHAQLWSKNLTALLQAWTGLGFSQIGLGISQLQPGVWELNKHDSPNLFFFESQGDWVVIDCGDENQLQLDNKILEPFLKTRIAVAETNWLTADLNWPRLAQLFPVLAKFDFPKIQAQVTARDGNFQMNGKLILSQPLPPLAQWRMPTNTIHQPLVSFTAARGFAPWLGKKNLPYEISPVPDQVFIWALANVPFQTFVAVPVPNADNALAQLGRKMSANTNWQHHFITPFPMVVSSNQISWQSGPFMIMPNLTALHEPPGDFLFAGVFPNGPRKKQPLPPELFTRMVQPGLVYYHWEITAERLQELPQFSQLVLMLTGHRQVDVQSAAGKWLGKIRPTLGNTVTEIFQTAPDELRFNRKSPGGLNALELLALVDWLEAPDFPAFDLSMPVLPHLKNRRIPMASPMPAPSPH